MCVRMHSVAQVSVEGLYVLGTVLGAGPKAGNKKGHTALLELTPLFLRKKRFIYLRE